MTPSPDALEKARRLLAQHYADSRYAHNAEPLAAALQTAIEEAAALRAALTITRANAEIAVADARKAALEIAPTWHEEMAISALARNHVGSTNAERRNNRAIADWHTTSARLIRSLTKGTEA